MADHVVVEDWAPGRKLWLKTPGRYSMDVAAEILRWLETEDDCSIPDSGWASAGFGNLVENGILVALGHIQFSVMCSYDDLFIQRVAGNNRKFTTLCETIQRQFVTT